MQSSVGGSPPLGQSDTSFLPCTKNEMMHANHVSFSYHPGASGHAPAVHTRLQATADVCGRNLPQASPTTLLIPTSCIP